MHQPGTTIDIKRCRLIWVPVFLSILFLLSVLFHPLRHIIQHHHEDHDGLVSVHVSCGHFGCCSQGKKDHGDDSQDDCHNDGVPRLQLPPCPVCFFLNHSGYLLLVVSILQQQIHRVQYFAILDPPTVELRDLFRCRQRAPPLPV